MRPSAALSISVLALSAALAGCGNDTADPAATDAPAPAETSAAAEPTTVQTPSTETASATPSTGGAETSGERNERAVTAIATAEAELNGTAVAIDHDQRTDTWEVEVRVGDQTSEVQLDAAGTAVTGVTDEENLDDDDAAELDAAQISLTEALEIAFGEADGELDDADITDEDDRIVYQVSLDQADNSEIEVLLQVTDGQVLEVRNDD
ncbi:PepSY domain-containing protein [Naumannella halotolerans]|uniref:Putative membrane protein YkoI n=1 Tax=Naumannella halotolerans TaxID=993414 RepID=A0A4V3EME6_9ACTN|nr:PepSY domain-containing protein [Naumannella halotolerans]TDT29818.1 putative membrane protein YkoI [Naumannella halotolerans]